MEHKPGLEQWHFQSNCSIDKVIPQDISAIILDHGVSVCSPPCKHQRITLSDLLYSRLPMEGSILFNSKGQCDQLSSNPLCPWLLLLRFRSKKSKCPRTVSLILCFQDILTVFEKHLPVTMLFLSLTREKKEFAILIIQYLKTITNKLYQSKDLEC